MPRVITKDDYQVTRSFLRWAAIGVQPATAKAQEVVSIMDSVRQEGRDLLAAVRSVADNVRAGVMVSKDACVEAEVALAGVYAEQFDLVDAAHVRELG